MPQQIRLTDEQEAALKKLQKELLKRGFKTSVQSLAALAVEYGIPQVLKQFEPHKK